MDPVKLGQLLCSKLCHDVINPVGAISSCFGLLDDSEGEDYLQLMTLAKQSTEKAVQKLVFYRAAFGYSTPSHVASLDETKRILQSFLESVNINFFWYEKEQLDNKSSSIEVLSLWLQLIKNLTLICSEIAPYGGKLTFTSISTHNLCFDMKLEGKLVSLKKEVNLALIGQLEESQVSSRTIHALYTHLLCKRLGIILEISEQEHVSLELKSKP